MVCSDSKLLLHRRRVNVSSDSRGISLGHVVAGYQHLHFGQDENFMTDMV